MNVLLISQCSKNALTETRRILDQFAERRGDRSWQTPITQAGLDSLYRLLRKSARKNTAVACHWIRGKDHSELLWIVGDARQFNAQGATPTNITRRDVLRSQDENDWHAGEDIRLLARLAALFHDFGKANAAFQKKLRSTQATADAFRHEWVSLRLFEAFVGEACPDDRDWLERLTRLDGRESARVVDRCKRDTERHLGPFKTLRHPLARAVGWLIVSHHRLPDPPETLQAHALSQLPAGMAHDWCGSRPDDVKASAACWDFREGLPLDSRHWREHASATAQAILARPGLSSGSNAALLASPYVLHLARLALMLADHYYSSQPSQSRYGDAPRGDKTLYANSQRAADGKPSRKQRLDEHLIGVEVNAGRLLRTLPRLERSLPRIARHKGFRARASGPYRWQNSAFDLAESLCERSAEHGFFGINMASTGCGKTLANGRILYALANPRLGARFTIALGLRTLTLQTGDAYQERLGLGPEDLAVLVGGAALRDLHAHAKAQGSESAADLLPADSHVRFEGSIEDGPLKRWLYPESASDGGRGRGRNAAALLDAPVLVCTVDHLTPATESTRGGHQILPMLRLMTSDLVLDEPDDFDVADLPALSRLVHWAGLLGSRVLLSSATLPPALVRGLFLAYCAGRREFQRHRGQQRDRLSVCSAWFDEFGAEHGMHDDSADGRDFLAAHEAFVDRRIGRLAANEEPRRRGTLVPIELAAPSGTDPAERRAGLAADFAGVLREQALALHRAHHCIDPASGKRVSFGLVRMANIDPLFDVARALFVGALPGGHRIHLCPYHARHPLLVRSAIERELDATLRRSDDPARDAAVFARDSVRTRLDDGSATDHLFIVLATAVAEVGRDHDYDWAIVEPSSMRSIIQLAGRVKRHRKKAPCPPERPNIALLDTNFKHLEKGNDKLAFRRPGFEAEDFPLRQHRLRALLSAEQWQTIDARPRIRPRTPIDAGGNLADLEHARLQDLMLGAQTGQTQKQRPVHRWWSTPAHLTARLQRSDPFRHDPQGSETFVLLPDDDGASIEFAQLPDGPRGPAIAQPTLIERLDIALPNNANIAPWGVPDYLDELQALADAFGLELADCARRFGTVELPGDRNKAQRWRYHPALGFSRI